MRCIIGGGTQQLERESHAEALIDSVVRDGRWGVRRNAGLRPALLQRLGSAVSVPARFKPCRPRTAAALWVPQPGAPAALLRTAAPVLPTAAAVLLRSASATLRPISVRAPARATYLRDAARLRTRLLWTTDQMLAAVMPPAQPRLMQCVSRGFVLPKLLQ